MHSKKRKRPRGSAQQLSGRLAALRASLDDDPASTGDQALKLIEEYLEELARAYGYRDDGSMGRYAMFLRGRSRDGLSVPDELLDQIEGYTQLRNCLAHTYGLQTSPALAAELLGFIEQLLKLDATTAARLMTRDVQIIRASERLTRARDLMLRTGYGRLPVVGEQGGIAGLLTERDIVAAQVLAERTGRELGTLTVAEALPEDADERIALARPEASRDEVAERLRRRGVVACLVTANGSADETPIGIITHADLLYRM
ncbi:MAG TPA: CBS domain-containing protein [Roseiflexaceae bacterium]|nr:CBS domain-containing protein [Roseiflexaceae bacterium]